MLFLRTTRSRVFPVRYVGVVLYVLSLLVYAPRAGAVDTDGDGLLDLLDLPGFDPDSSQDIDFWRAGIQDLDGATLLVNTTNLSLEGNEISSIELGDFAGLGNLQTLDLADNRISRIEPRAFTGLGSLQTLDLAANRISRIEPGDFDGLGDLETLDLTNNEITSIEPGDFDGLGGLQALNLSYNQVSNIEPGAFRAVSDLHTLVLTGNPTTELDLSGATLVSLRPCSLTVHESGFCPDLQVSNLVIDRTSQSNSSFQVLVDHVPSVRNVSLVGLKFQEELPHNLNHLFASKPFLRHITVDPLLHSMYADEFRAWSFTTGNRLTVVDVVDLNRDGAVDASDAGLVFAEWGDAPYGWSIGDFNDDGIVDAADAGELFTRWTGDVSSVPEPNTVCLATLVTAALVWSQRRRRRHDEVPLGGQSF